MSLRFWSLAALLVAITGALAALSIGFFRFNGIEAVVWPANAIVLAFLLRGFRDGRERAVALAGVLTVMVVVNLLLGRPPAASVVFSAANVIELLVAAWTLRRLRMPMSEAGDYLRFLGGAVLAGPALSALAATTAVATLGMTEGAGGLIAFARGWFLSDALGMAVVAPFALTIPLRLPRLKLNREVVAALLAQLLVFALAVAACLALPAPIPFSAFIFPAVAIAVFTGRDRGGLAAVAIVATTMITGAALGMGPAARAEQIGVNGIVFIQVLLVALVATVHPLSAVLRRLDAYAADAEARRREAELLSERKTRFLSEASQDIRSPLTGVLTLAEILQSGRAGSLTRRQQELLSHIAESGAQIEDLSQRLQDAAALQDGSATLARSRLNLAALAADAATAARFKIRDRACEIRVGDIASGLDVEGDERRLRLIIIGLLVEASAFAARPGKVTISAEPGGGRRVRIHIDDNGEGVPDERRAELMTAAETPGAGVGLGLTRDLVRMQGGDLGLVAGPLGGARVWLELAEPRSASRAA